MWALEIEFGSSTSVVYVYVSCLQVCLCTHSVGVCSSEDNLKELALFSSLFEHQTQVVRLASNYSYPGSRLTDSHCHQLLILIYLLT